MTTLPLNQPGPRPDLALGAPSTVSPGQVARAAQVLAASPAPAVHGAHAVAEELVLLVHRGVDWQVWGGARRVRYWEALADRVRAGTYAGPTLDHWWQAVSTRITSTPRNPQDRADLSALLATSDQRAVLAALRSTAEVVVLRVRVAVEALRMTSPTSDAQEGR